MKKMILTLALFSIPAFAQATETTFTYSCWEVFSQYSIKFTFQTWPQGKVNYLGTELNAAYSNQETDAGSVVQLALTNDKNESLGELHSSVDQASVNDNFAYSQGWNHLKGNIRGSNVECYLTLKTPRPRTCPRCKD